MKRLQRVGSVLVATTLALAVGGCSEIKDDAIEAGAEIAQLCKDKKNDQANSKGVAMYEKNVVFKAAIDDTAAAYKIGDVATYNYCGFAFKEAQRKMREAKDPESCSCRTVGAAPGSNRVAWLFLAGLAVAVARRRRSP